jgi:uncharacterized protein (TIGR02147 family)
MPPLQPALKTVTIFAYLDYRRYLRDWYEMGKATRKSLSFRAFSQRAGFKSPNFFKLVMEGKRNLTDDSLGKFADGLKLNRQERDFFKNLVLFTQASDHEDKNFFYQRLLETREFARLKPMEKSRYEYYATWYHPVVRELAVSPESDGSCEWIAKRIRPVVTPDQVQKSLDLLVTLGFLQKKGARRWKQTEPLVTTGAEVPSVTLMNYHQSLLTLTRDVLPAIPAAERDISALTLGVSRDKLPLLKKRIQDFRQGILRFVSLEEKPEDVVMLNIQFFPVTRRS